MKKLLLYIVTITTIFSGQIEIKSQSVLANDAEGITTFQGDVTILRDKDIMKAEKVVVFLNKEREIHKFQANGNTSFFLNLDNNQTFKGKAESFIYLPIEREFILKGNAIVEDVMNKRKLLGNEIVFDEKSRTANIKGKVKEPVKVIFNVADEKEN